ncbi:MAG: prepilin-type N-terminal cleavage/methylation domain-containing protein [Planctomycetota bacterium]
MIQPSTARPHPFRAQRGGPRGPRRPVRPGAAGPARRRGLTLVELMVAMVVLLVLVGLALYVLMLALKSWSMAQRERDVHDRAMAAIDVVRTDVAAVALPTSNSHENVIVMYGAPHDPHTAGQDNSFLYLVRTIERGKEMAETYLAADGQPPVFKNELPPNAFNLPALAPNLQQSVDNQALQSVNDAQVSPQGYDLQALGGIMEVAYFVDHGTLYRYFHSPVTQPFQLNRDFPIEDCAAVVDHVLFFQVLYWTPVTTSWEAPPLLGPKSLNGKAGAAGPETMWDSTRTLSDFTFFSNQPNPRPIYPQRVKITLVLDWDPRFDATETLADDIGPGAGSIRLASADDLPAGGRDDSYVLIDKEWIRYTRIDGDTLILDTADQTAPGQRGARGSAPDSHSAGTPVHFGRTFTYYLTLPQGDPYLPDDMHR